MMMLKITAGLGKTVRNRVVGSDFRAPDGLGMTLVATGTLNLKLPTSRFSHGIASESLSKQHHESQFSEIDGLVRRSFSLRPPARRPRPRKFYRYGSTVLLIRIESV